MPWPMFGTPTALPGRCCGVPVADLLGGRCCIPPRLFMAAIWLYCIFGLTGVIEAMLGLALAMEGEPFMLRLAWLPTGEP